MNGTIWWEYFGRLANIIGIATVFFAGYTAFRLWIQNRRFRELAKRLAPIDNFQQLLQSSEGVKTTSPVAFALCLYDKNDSIKKSVEAFLSYNKWSMPIEEIKLNGINGPEGLETFVNKLREKRRIVEEMGYTEIHLFIAGPVQAGTIVGGQYHNWIPIKLYHKPVIPLPQIYEYWMPLM